VWCRIPGNKTSQFIEGGFIASYYRNILKSALLLYLENVTVATTEGMWVDEGLPPHVGRQHTENLNKNCQDEEEVVDRWHGHLGH